MRVMMPRYFFDICDSDSRIPDDEGTECADLNAALREAEASARDLVKQYVDGGRPISSTHIAIRDEAGEVKLRWPLAGALGKFH
jgi:hypothetical protein